MQYRLDEAGIIVLNVPDACAHRSADPFIGRVEASMGGSSKTPVERRG
jgi:hypothetical protein